MSLEHYIRSFILTAGFIVLQMNNTSKQTKCDNTIMCRGGSLRVRVRVCVCAPAVRVRTNVCVCVCVYACVCV